MKIDTICNDFLKALTDASYNEHTIFNYQGVIRRFKAYCNQMGVTIYTPEFGQTYYRKTRYHGQRGFCGNEIYTDSRRAVMGVCPAVIGG